MQKLFAANERHGGQEFRAVGVLADYAEVQEKHEAAIEQFLRDELEYVVVETFDVARAGIALLRDEVGGRATFFVDSLRKLNLKTTSPSCLRSRTASSRDSTASWNSAIRSARRQNNSCRACSRLSWWSSAVVAERLARENPAYSFVTPDGTTLSGTRGQRRPPREAGPLGMKRELRALDAEVLQLERAAEEAQAALESPRRRTSHRQRMTLEASSPRST